MVNYRVDTMKSGDLVKVSNKVHDEFGCFGVIVETSSIEEKFLRFFSLMGESDQKGEFIWR